MAAPFTLRPPPVVEPLLRPYIREGEIVDELPSLQEIQTLTRGNLLALDKSYKRIINPHIYKVSISDGVKETKRALLRRYLGSEV